MGEIVKLRTQNFEDEVLKATLPVLVDFTAVWCGPCKMLEPIVVQLANDWENRVRVVQVDVDEHPEIAMNYQVMSVPTLMLFVGGEVVDRAVGYQPKDRLIKKFSPYL